MHLSSIETASEHFWGLFILLQSPRDVVLEVFRKIVGRCFGFFKSEKIKLKWSFCLIFVALFKVFFFTKFARGYIRSPQTPYPRLHQRACKVPQQIKKNFDYFSIYYFSIYYFLFTFFYLQFLITIFLFTICFQFYLFDSRCS